MFFLRKALEIRECTDYREGYCRGGSVPPYFHCRGKALQINSAGCSPFQDALAKTTHDDRGRKPDFRVNRMDMKIR
jgi:hypothetical protein